MQTEQIVALLVAERNRLDAAIQALQSSTKRNGRPPKTSGKTSLGSARVGRKRTLSAAGRKAIADAARKRWAAVKAAKTPAAPVVERKRNISAAGRKAMADAAKKRWVAIKAGKAANPFKKARGGAGKEG